MHTERLMVFVSAFALAGAVGCGSSKGGGGGAPGGMDGGGSTIDDAGALDDAPDTLRRLVDRAHESGKRVKLSVGGWTGSK